MRRTPTYRRSQRAFTLVEIITAMAITSIIVFALIAMFNQTQKALRISLAEGDVWESARAGFTTIANDIQELTPSRFDGAANVYVKENDTESPDHPLAEYDIESMFLLGREGNNWIGNVYWVKDENGLPTLYRFRGTYPSYLAGNPGYSPPVSADLLDPTHPYGRALQWALNPANDPQPEDYHRLVDGIVEFSVRVYDGLGRPYTNTVPDAAAPVYIDDITSSFSGTALPAFVDVSMTVLSPDRFEEYRAQISDANREAYLSNHVGDMQRFQRRIALHNESSFVVQ